MPRPRRNRRSTEMQSTNWAPEHCEALRENLAKGMSYSEIAEAINAKFNTAYSRKCRARPRQANGARRHGPPRELAQAADESRAIKVAQNAGTLRLAVGMDHPGFRT